MRRLITTVVVGTALALAGTAVAALQPGVYDPGNTGCPVATYSDGVLHLEKNCATSVEAAAGADITGVEGQAFVSASFTLDGTAQCNGGSPRFNVETTTGFFFLGCNNVVPVLNADGTATYTFDAATLAAAGQQVPTPTGDIVSMSILIDVQGTADITGSRVNGQLQRLAGPTAADQCKNGGWQDFDDPAFKNQGDCVSFVASGGRNEAAG
ncbi:MAG TPA: hypothetical protein VLB86_07095 [Gaiellaceae bacterium]|nr:hypothetical protein [Gaiellaceae bacterium]